MGTTGNYFQGFGEQAYRFGDLGSHAKKKKKTHLKGKAFISSDFFFKKSSASGGKPPKPPLGKSKCHYFRANIWVMVTDMVNSFYYCGKLSLKLLIFRLIKRYFGTLIVHQIAPF